MSPSAVWSPHVSLTQALFALSDALDLVGVDDVFHGKRVAWLAHAIVKILGAPELARDVHHAALVHDCGVSSSVLHQRLVAKVTAIDGHSEAGARLVGDFQPLAHLADVIRFHHSPYPELVELEPRTAKVSNLIFLADRLDVMQATAAPGAQLDVLAEERLFGPWAHLFAPELVDAAREALRDAEVVDALRDPTRERLVVPVDDMRFVLTSVEARGLALLFAQTVDAKSAFTARHSNGVAALALHLADASGRLKSSREALEIAALLHDLGKLRVPDAVLDKPGALDAHELRVMREHAGASRSILARIGGFEDIARFAGQHHELLDGSGYPHGLRGDEISMEAQFITVADIFQALAQDRPYRRAMSPDDILAVLQSQARQGRLDAGLVAIAAKDLSLMWTLARASEPVSELAA